jgi:hypothetical protein
MNIRKLFYILTAATLAAGLIGTVVSCKNAVDAPAGENAATGVVAADGQAAKEEMVELLFVQYAETATLSEGVLTLRGVVPDTLYFSDRPHRIVGRVTTQNFVKSWDEGEGNFSEIPPNAVLAVMHKPVPLDLVVVLKNPVLEDDTLTYQVEVLEGPDSGEGEASALFIDVFGISLDDVRDIADDTVGRVKESVDDYGENYDSDYDDPDDQDAYRDGYKDAWYDNSYDDDYDDRDERDAYREGYENGRLDGDSSDDDYDDPDDRDAYREGYEDGRNDNSYDDDYDDRDERDAYREGYENGRRDRDNN